MNETKQYNTTNLNKKNLKVRKIYYLKLFNFFIKEAKDVRFKMLINNSETQLINRYYFEFFLTKLIV